jgi:hypothetical protein
MVIQGPPGRQQLPRFERLRIGMLLLKNATLLEQQLQLAEHLQHYHQIVQLHLLVMRLVQIMQQVMPWQLPDR